MAGLKEIVLALSLGVSSLLYPGSVSAEQRSTFCWTGKHSGSERCVTQTYWPDGTIKSGKRTVDGKKLAEWHRYPDGKMKKYLSKHSDGSEREGHFFKDGSPKRKSYRSANNKLDGILQEWYAPGKKKIYCVYNEGVKDGKCLKYHPNGQKTLDASYIDGKRDGKYMRWAPDGTVLEKGLYDDGKEMGIHTNYHMNGQVLYEGRYVDGKEEGWHQSWSSEGQLLERLPYVGGKLHGTGAIWDGDGNLRMIADFAEDKLHGNKTYYFPDKSASKEVWTEGKCIYRQIVDEYGKVVNEMIASRDKPLPPQGHERYGIN